MECEDAEQESESAKIVSDPGQPRRREQEKHEATHVQFRSWRIACVRGRGIATKHFRHASAHASRVCYGRCKDVRALQSSGIDVRDSVLFHTL